METFKRVIGAIIITLMIFTASFYLSGCQHISGLIEKAENWAEANPNTMQRIQDSIDAVTTVIAITRPEYAEIALALDDVSDGLAQGTTSENVSKQLAAFINAQIEKYFPDEQPEVRKLLAEKLANVIKLPAARGEDEANEIIALTVVELM